MILTNTRQLARPWDLPGCPSRIVWGVSTSPLILAQLTKTDTAPAAAAALWAILALCAVLFVGTITLLTIRRRSRLNQTRERPPATKHTDAWAEAGRRAEPLPIDRVDLGDEDWDEPEDDEPWRESLND